MKYKATLLNVLIFAAPALLALLLLYILSNQSFGDFFKRSYVYWMIILSIIVLSGYFTYARVKNDKLYFVSWLFSRRSSKISDITEIRYESAMKVFKGVLHNYYIIFQRNDGSENFMTIPEALFTKKTLGLLFDDLVSRNPNIKIDDYSSKLLNKNE